MKKKKHVAVDLFALGKWALCAGLVIIMGFNLLFTVPSLKPALFKGYCTVYYRGKIPLHDIVSQLQKQADIQAVISGESAELVYTNFSEFEKVAVDKIEERFDPRDPRLDDYMKKINQYFTIKQGDDSWNIFYVSTRRNPLYLSFIMDGILKNTDAEWHIYELELNGVIVLVTITGTVFFLLLMLLRRQVVYYVLLFLGTLPWVYALARGGIHDFLLFFFIAFYWSLFIHEFIDYFKNDILFKWRDPDTKPLFLRLGLFLGMVMITFFFTSIHKTDLIEITLAVFLQGCVLGGYIGFLLGRRFLQTKKNILIFQFFKPLEILRILKPGNLRPFRNGYVNHGLVILLFLIPFIFFFQGSATPVLLPVPESRATEKGMSLEAIGILARAKNASSLPDLSDFVRHAAYQERLAYGGAVYDLPGENDELVLAVFKVNESTSRVEKQSKVVLRFDNAWLARTASQVSESSIEKMLFNQGECTTVSFKKSVTDSFFGHDIWIVLILWCIVLVPIILLYYTAVPHFIYGLRREFVSAIKKKR